MIDDSPNFHGNFPRPSLNIHSPEPLSHELQNMNSQNFECIFLVVSRELSARANRFSEKKVRKFLPGSLNLIRFLSSPHLAQMPNDHKPDKEPLSLQVPRTLLGRIKIAAKKAEQTVPEYVTTELTKSTHDIVLTSEDYRAIAEATERAEKTGKRCATKFPSSKGA